MINICVSDDFHKVVTFLREPRIHEKNICVADDFHQVVTRPPGAKNLADARIQENICVSDDFHQVVTCPPGAKNLADARIHGKRELF